MSSTLILVGKIAASGAIAAGALVGGVTATHSTAAPAESTTAAKVHCAKFRHAPAALKADLKKLRALPKGDARIAFAKQIRKDARAGKYGARVQRIAERRQQARAAFLANAPAQLKADLKAAKAEPAGTERRDAFKAVWASALDGTYGADVQARAEKRKDHHEACQAKRATRKAA